MIATKVSHVYLNVLYLTTKYSYHIIGLHKITDNTFATDRSCIYDHHVYDLES